MKNQIQDKLTKNKITTSYLTTVISISLVLFLIGVTCLLVLNAKKLSDHIKENLGFTIFLKDNVKEVDIIRLQKDFDATYYVKSTEYISKDQAAEDLKISLGEDFVDFLGYNPLLASIEVKLLADYANPDSLVKIENDFMTNPLVSEVSYQKSLLHLINDNVRKISITLLIFSALLFFISFVLINNTIRLMIYAKRFTIKTMQLVGATRSFIRMPFLLKGALQGFIGSILAIFLLFGVIHFAQKEMQELISLADLSILSLLILIVLIIGISISTLSTYFAVNKYLNLKSENLYF